MFPEVKDTTPQTHAYTLLAINTNMEVININELKQRKTENGINYVLVGDYYIPDLKLPEENRPIGKFGRMGAKMQ